MKQVCRRSKWDTVSIPYPGAGFCRFDAEREVIWVKNMMRYQGNNDKTRVSARHHLQEDLHNSPLIDEFLANYPEVAKLWPDRVPIGYPEKSSDATPDSRSLIPEKRDLNTEKREKTLALGEFEQVRLTPEEHAKLKVKLNSHLSDFIDQLDRYSQTHPKEFRKYVNHYAVIQSWFDKAVKDGKIQIRAPADELAAVQQVREIFRKKNDK